MNRDAFIRILETLRIYTSSEFDGVYISNEVLDELCDELKKAIHCDKCCSRERTEKWLEMNI